MQDRSSRAPVTQFYEIQYRFVTTNKINVREYQRIKSRNGQSIESGNMWYTKRRKHKNTTLCVAQQYLQTNTNNVCKT